MPKQSSISQYLVAFNPGLADIVTNEVHKINTEAIVHPFYNLQGWLLIHGLNLEQTLQLHSIERVIELLDSFYFDKSLTDLEQKVAGTFIPQLLNGESFRVSTRRYGNHEFGSSEVQVVAGRVIQNNYNASVSLKEYEVHVRVDVIARFAYIGIQRTPEKWGKRYHFKRFHRAGIKPSMAYALIEMANLEERQTLLDPFMGGGTIPIEAASLWGSQVKILGSDLYDEAIEQAQTNAEWTGFKNEVTFIQSDIYHLDESVAGPIDAIVSNPPYGVKSATNANMRKLYRGFILKAAKVLKLEGRMVVMVQRTDMFRQLIGRTKLFKVIEERVVESSSLSPHVFVLGKIDHPD